MELDPATLSPSRLYPLMISCIVPRPIAWTSTQDESGRRNLAPFSFFGGVSADPFTVMVSVGRRDGARKDTARNLLAMREAVIHVVNRPLAEKMVATSADVDEEISEFELVGLTPLPSVRVRPARVAGAPIALEARVDRHLEVGSAPVDLFLLEVVYLHVADELLVAGVVDPKRLDAVGRLGGAGYCETTHTFSIRRP